MPDHCTFPDTLIFLQKEREKCRASGTIKKSGSTTSCSRLQTAPSAKGAVDELDRMVQLASNCIKHAFAVHSTHQRFQRTSIFEIDHCCAVIRCRAL